MTPARNEHVECNSSLNAHAKGKTPISSIYAMPSHLLWSNRHLGRALRTIGVVVVIAFLVVVLGSIRR